MGKFREAAEVLFRRQLGIYGSERIMHVAKKCGYAIDSNGTVLYVEDEKEAFDKLSGTIETELGPIAVIGSKMTLMSFFAQGAISEQKTRDAMIGVF